MGAKASLSGTNAFHDEGSIEPTADQNLSFNQTLNGLQAGVTWATKMGNGSLSISPAFALGTAKANMNANLASADGDMEAYGINVNYRSQSGFYLDAGYQKMEADIDLMASALAEATTGMTEAEADGFNIEAGYTWAMKSGLSIEPQVQYSTV